MWWPFHPLNLAQTLSTSGWKSTHRNRMVVSGSPRYLIGKCVCAAGRPWRILVMFKLEHLIGTMVDFKKFVTSPEAWPNRVRRSAMAFASFLSGLRNMAASSAFIEILTVGVQPLHLLRIPCFVAWLMSCCSGSIAIMKRSGDNGSPYRSPRLWQIVLVGTPLRRTHE
ncbi:hypothetical protein SEVIR_1G257550v4 [Setaria viridis]